MDRIPIQENELPYGNSFRPLSDYEREQWATIIHICMTTPGSVTFTAAAKAIIIAVARQLEEVESRGR